TKWVWKSELQIICYSDLKVCNDPSISHIDAEQCYQLLLSEGTEKSKWRDFLRIQKNDPLSEQLLYKVSKQIACYKLSGNIVKLRKNKWMEAICSI
ncbi:MAG: hypothetical protein PHU66_10740, partial [Bacteroidaceae bacterium]|nr:hypothetical protein [Bacteroidaceae bacterium]